MESLIGDGSKFQFWNLEPSPSPIPNRIYIRQFLWYNIYVVFL